MQFGPFNIGSSEVSPIFAEMFGFSAYDYSGSTIYANSRMYLYFNTPGQVRVATYWMAQQNQFDILYNIPVPPMPVGGYTTEQKKAYVRACFQAVAEKYHKEPGEGQVKSYVKYFATDGSEAYKQFWRCRRPSSQYTFEYEGRYFETKCIEQGEFMRVWTALDRSTHRLVATNTVGRGNEVRVGTDYYERDILTPIYLHNNGTVVATTADYIASYETPEQAERIYEQARAPSGAMVYINKEKPGVAYFKSVIHNYSARIEQFVPADHLFQKGEFDLYKSRHDEITPFLGWELEACGTQEAATKLKEMMQFDLFCKSDSSITPAGFETVSVPATLDFWKQSNLSDALDAVRGAPFGLRSFKHSSCGFHVHVSRAALSVLDLNKIERFVHNPENNAFLIDIAGRGSNTYAKYVPALFTDRKNVRTQQGGDTPYRRRAASPSAIPQNTMDDLVLAYSSTPEQGIVETIWSYVSLAEPLYDMVYKSMIRQIPFNVAVDTVAATYEGVEDLTSSSKAMIKQILKAFLPDRFGDTGNNPVSKFVDFQCLAKSSAPSDRRKSRDAARTVKGPVGKGSVGRYDVLNTGNDNTVEFRLFKGTLNPDSVFRYLEFVDAMVRYAWSVGAKDEFLSHSYFCGWLISDPFNIARYEKLVAFLVEKGYIDRKNIRRKKLSYTLDTNDNG